MTVPESSAIDLTGQTAVVTGAAGDIGTATCASLAREGATIVATDIDHNGLTEVADRVRAHGQSCEPVACDVSDPTQVSALQQASQEAFGRIDILVTAHGVIERGSLAEITVERWHHLLAVNLLGTVLTTQTFYEQMVDTGNGKIIHIGSIAGQIGGVDSGPHYVASKGAIHAFTKWLAQDGADHGVYVNAIAPGPVRTTMTAGGEYADDMVPLGRLGTPADIAEGVVFLASQSSNWITGTVLDVNGGLLMA